MKRVRKSSHPSRVNRSSEVGTKATVSIVHGILTALAPGWPAAGAPVAEKAGPDAPFRTVKWKSRNERVNPRMSRISLFGRLGPALVLSAALFDACNTSKASPAPPSPPEVSVITVHPEKVSLSTEWIATLDGYVNAQIRPQVPGYLVRRDYEEGTIVRKDQVLFEIDPRPFEAALAQAQARLGEAQAQVGRTERDLERDRPLAAQRAIAQSQLDNDIQANLAAQAAIKSATAAVDSAQLNLGFTKVTSLITGVAAIA